MSNTDLYDMLCRIGIIALVAVSIFDIIVITKILAWFI